MFRSALQLIYGPKVLPAFDSDDQLVYSRSAADSGSPVVQLYRSQFRKDGTLELIPDGEHDLYAEIQSHAASTDIQMILQRYFNGDPAALSRIQGVYADVTEMPKDIHQAMQMMDTARADFARLPVDIKELFDNDANQWLASLGTADWYSKMGVSSPVESPADVVSVAPDTVPVAPPSSSATSTSVSGGE